ncbi:DsbA family protein [Pacificimonas sp. ICDLI1SI03]
MAPTSEPADYDVTIVSFSDYQCPYCRKIHPTLEKLVTNDPRVRIVYRDWPIFGAASEEAARAAIASQWQDKHAPFNDALMRTEGKLTTQRIQAAATAAGVDWAQLQQDMETRGQEIDDLIDRTSLQAAKMGLQGTPALLVGPYLIPGAVDYTTLTETVGLARDFEQRSD